MLLSLDPHQRTTIDYAVEHPFSILALEMGLGKSACALGVWERVGGKFLIVCPSYLVLNWRDEIRKFLGDGPIITMIRKGKDLYEIFDSDFVIISYDLVQKSEQLFEWADAVIADEGQELKNPKAKRSEYFHRVIYENSIRRLHILTGTPIKNRVEEYYSLLALMNYDPRLNDKSQFLKRFPDSITFADHFAHRREYTMKVNGYKWVKIVKWEGIRNIPELKNYIKGNYIRFSSKDVLKLDEPRMKDVLLSDVDDPKLLTEFDAFYKDEKNQSVESSAKADAALRKVPFTVKYVKGLLETIDCVPIYTDHVESAKALAKAFGVEAITGAMPAQKRAAIGKKFQSGEVQVLVATVKSFSTGISLTRANNLVFNDLPWVPGDIQQTIYRVQRRDQTRSVTIHRLLGSPQDRKIMYSLDNKISAIAKIV